ncbi:hypothetical protein P8452_14697 [Trifolium repens]|nr:hypothetical protein P8452_14697 [Trifolium repens]
MAAATTTLVGNAFLTATIETLLHKLASEDFIDYIKRSNLSVLKLTVFETSLLALHSVLHDAENKQFFNLEVKQWMDELYNVISVADDLIDEIGYRSLQCKVENTQPQQDLEFNYQLKSMCLSLHHFVQQIDVIGLQSVSGRVSYSMVSSSVVNESFIVGRKDDKEILMNMLLSSGSDTRCNYNNNLGVIAILGVEGFLEQSQGEKAPEQVGDDYFVELLSRSFIQELKYDTKRIFYVMHDLLYDLAAVVFGKSCCRLECGGSISKHIHHLSYIQEEYDTFKKFEISCDFKCLRSFLPINIQRGLYYLSRKVVDDLIPTVRSLRMLSLSHYKNFTMLPDSISNLLHLRYLDLSYTNIKSLPDSTCDLYYLQTLNLSCSALTELPVDIGKLINLRHLNISGARISKMPKQIVGLENLQTLSVFVVGKQEVGLSVRELGKFPYLRGKLSIKNLHNVIDVSEVCDANLKSKEHLEELELCCAENFEDSPIDKVVLDVLQPSINLKKLTIGLYGGTSFPSWLGDSSFSNMVYLYIGFCEYCVALPPLGQLPSLKDLRIKNMSILETIGPEFYGMSSGGSNSPFQPFPSLECLNFSFMTNWKEWVPFKGRKFPFPQLKTLKLDGCRKLRGHLPGHLSSIEEIAINDCDSLLETLPNQHSLSLVKSLDVTSRGTKWSFFECDSARVLQRVKVWNFETMLSVPKMLLSTTSLQHLVLYNIPSLTAFPDDGLPTFLKSLEIASCENLAFPPPETWSNYTSLVTLRLSDCDALTSFPLNGFPVLQRLCIESCNSLQCFFISEISSHCPSTLQLLVVYDCDALKSFPQRMETLTSLESLTLKPLLPCYEGGCLPPKLRLINIESQSPSTTMPVTGWGIQNLNALSDLRIGGDGIVNSLLKERLLPISLVSLTINNLSKRKSLPRNGLQHLSSLENLIFNNCSRLESFSEDMLPSSLKSLVFDYCPKLKSLPERLPSSLENLIFKYCSRLESLSEYMLPSSLKSLLFDNCPKLKSLPERLPSSLEILELDECRRLGALPKHGLPSSLKRLRISHCDMLKARYENQRGEHWSNIAHIPVIKVDDELTI